MIQINNLRDLDRLVATSLSERRAIHESGAWRWAAGSPTNWNLIPGHWEPAPFSTDPAASYALEQRLCELGLEPTMQFAPFHLPSPWVVALYPDIVTRQTAQHKSRLIAMCLASLRALGVEFELVEGWDK